MVIETIIAGIAAAGTLAGGTAAIMSSTKKNKTPQAPGVGKDVKPLSLQQLQAGQEGMGGAYSNSVLNPSARNRLVNM